MGHGAPDTNRNYHERVEGPRVRVVRTRDKARDRGARVTREPRVVLGMLAPNSDAKAGIVSDGELDGNDCAPVVVEAVQVGAERAASAVVVVSNRRGSTTIASPPGSLSESLSGGASIASDRSRTQVARDNKRVAADLRCGRTAMMAWSCRKRR